MTSEFECEDVLEAMVVFFPSEKSYKDCPTGRD